MNQLILAVILTVMPLVELRGGLPVALIEASRAGIPTFPIFLLILFLNILVIFFVFFFLDHLHKFLINYSFYKKFYSSYLKIMQKKMERFEKSHNAIGFLALFLLVAIPLPLTGAYTGSFLSWIFGLDRKKSILAISLGVLFAGLVIYFGTLGIISFLS